MSQGVMRIAFDRADSEKCCACRIDLDHHFRIEILDTHFLVHRQDLRYIALRVTELPTRQRRHRNDKFAWTTNLLPIHHCHGQPVA